MAVGTPAVSDVDRVLTALEKADVESMDQLSTRLGLAPVRIRSCLYWAGRLQDLIMANPVTRSFSLIQSHSEKCQQVLVTINRNLEQEGLGIREVAALTKAHKELAAAANQFVELTKSVLDIEYHQGLMDSVYEVLTQEDPLLSVKVRKKFMEKYPEVAGATTQPIPDIRPYKVAG